MMNEIIFWNIIEASTHRGTDWIAQLRDIEVIFRDYSLEDLLTFDAILQPLIQQTQTKLYQLAPDSFHEVLDPRCSLGCFTILLGSKLHKQIMADPILLEQDDYIKHYKQVAPVIWNLEDTPSYIFHKRTGKRIEDYKNNKEDLKELKARAIIS